MARSAGWPTRRLSASGHVSPVTVKIVHGWLVSAGTTITRMVNTIHMETPDVEDQEGQDEDPAPVHYSTGRLTRGQAALVNTGGGRRLRDRPVPGRRPVGEVARLLGLDNRPPASCSDIIAAAVTDLLREGPDEAGLGRGP